MVPFAGWAMPVQYPAGIIAEHQACRGAAVLFDVSHMGQLEVRSNDAADLIERLVPADVRGLKPGRARYTVLTDETGGILDDLIVSNTGEGLFFVVNASRRHEDVSHLRTVLPDLVELTDRALLALQGPAAATVLARLAPASAELRFMQTAMMTLSGLGAGGLEARVSRLGYTGEDGFEISLAADHAHELARTLLASEEVVPAGLGARDSLRLEAGLGLYGHDMTTATTPIEAGLAWSIQKRRRAEGGFPGAEVILAQLRDGSPRRLMGLVPEGRGLAREGAVIEGSDGRPIGKVTSGGFGPSFGGAIAMGYVETGLGAPGTAVRLLVRGRPLAAAIAALPFVPHRYHR